MLAKCYAKFDIYNEKTLGLTDLSNNCGSPCMDYTYLATLKSSYRHNRLLFSTLTHDSRNRWK